MNLESWMDILRCPACVGVASATDTSEIGAPETQAGADPGQLDLWADQWLICRDCGRKYPIRNQVPVLLIEEGDQHRATSVDELDTP